MLKKSQAIKEKIIEVRRHIHQHPELSYEEINTAAYLAEQLDNLGVYYRSGVAKTGLIAEISKNGKQEIDIKSELKSGKTAQQILQKPIIIIRADMDALPIQEDNDLSFCSKNKGIMHACGHDTHSAMVFGAVTLFKNLDFTGTVRFLFQPAEEGSGNDSEHLSGARRMILEGACNDVSAALGLHQIPTMPTGQISLKQGAVMAAADAFEIEVTGKASHAGATPELGIDAIAISAELISAIHHLVSRNVSPHDTAVLSIGTIQAGTALNIIADKANMRGTLRSIKKTTRIMLKSKLQRLCNSFASIHGTEIQLRFIESIPLTLNDPQVTKSCTGSARKFINEKSIIQAETIMGTEDFAFIAETVPSCFALLGTEVNDGPSYSLHNSKMLVNEDALPLGCAYLTQAALDLLEQYA